MLPAEPYWFLARFHESFRTMIRVWAVLAVVALAAGCGDGDSATAPVVSDPPHPTTVTVSPPTTELVAGGVVPDL